MKIFRGSNEGPRLHPLCESLREETPNSFKVTRPRFESVLTQPCGTRRGLERHKRLYLPEIRSDSTSCLTPALFFFCLFLLLSTKVLGALRN